MMVLVEVEISLSLQVPSIAFLNTRPAMIFISTTFGIAEIVRRRLGIEENNVVTVMIFMVTTVLWKENM
jgi:hypothetical protein